MSLKTGWQKRNSLKEWSARTDNKVLRVSHARSAAKINTGRIMVFVVLAGLWMGGLAVYQQLCRSEKFNITRINVSGLDGPEREEILKTSGVCLNTNIFKTDLKSAVERLKLMPQMAKARISRSLPGTVEISVVEKTPAAFVGREKEYQVDENGCIFNALPAGSDEKMPVINQVNFKADELGQPCRQAGLLNCLALLKTFRRFPELFSRLKTMDASSPENAVAYIEMPLAGTKNKAQVPVVEVRFGNDEFETKMNQLRILFRNLNTRAAYIDLRFKNGIVVGK